MTHRMIPVLLTSSVIAHDSGVRLQDPVQRQRLAMESVHRWSSLSPETPLVLCDGSGFDFSPLIEELPNAHQIECLRFQNDVATVRQYGRGYGEGEIVRHALEHSALIKASGAFIKCTSKLWVENFTECFQQWNGNLLLKAVFNNVFTPWEATTLAYIDTRFYAASIDTYRQHFLNAHLAVNAHAGNSLEECFKDKFVQAQFRGCLMSPPPVIFGVGGGTGNYYRNTPLRKQKERWRYKLAKCNPAFRSWFTSTNMTSK
jgi:hypothetical protein